MTTTVPNINETKPTEDWREGLVVREPGHVYGKTALTQQEWRQRAHKLAGHRFVTVYDGPHQSRPFVRPEGRWDAAMADLASAKRDGGSSAYGPDGGNRVTVLRVEDWRKSDRSKQCASTRRTPPKTFRSPIASTR